MTVKRFLFSQKSLGLRFYALYKIICVGIFLASYFQSGVLQTGGHDLCRGQIVVLDLPAGAVDSVDSAAGNIVHDSQLAADDQ